MERERKKEIERIELETRRVKLKVCVVDFSISLPQYFFLSRFWAFEQSGKLHFGGPYLVNQSIMSLV